MVKTAAEIVETAAGLVGGDRAKTHGDKGANFHKTAILWNAYLAIRRDTTAPLDGVDFALMMVLAKLSRIHSGSHNLDDFVDICGYGGCAGEVAEMLIAQGVSPDHPRVKEGREIDELAKRLEDESRAQFREAR